MQTLINEDVWHELVSLEEINPGILKDIIEIFQSASPKVQEDLKMAAQKSDFKILVEKAHSFKSSCNSIGALDLAEQLNQIENDAKKLAPTLDLKLLEKVLTHIKLVSAELEIRRNFKS